MIIRDRLIWIYIVLVTLIVAMGAWWAVYLSREGDLYERFRLQRFATDRVHAAHLLQSAPGFRENPEQMLAEHFPDLILRRTGDGLVADVDPEAEAAVLAEGRRRRRMIASEGAFFLLLLAGGMTVLVAAMRRERSYKRARELFLAGAAHEFRTPLASLRLYTETLGRTDLKDADRDRIHRTMVDDLGRLESMVEHVLALSRDERPSVGRERIDVGETAEEVLAGMAPFLDRQGAQITIDLPDRCAMIGDRDALSAALRNLVHNAVIYSPPPAQVSVSLARDGRKLRLWVADRGPCIPRRDHRRIFKSFVRLEDGSGGLRTAPTGSGLGLYLVKRNAELLGGGVELASEPGRGATFTLVLPAAAEEDA